MRVRRTIVTTAVVAATALGFSACSSSSGGTDTSSGQSQSKAPVADIKNLTGVMTQVTLDQGFVDGLTSLKLTPAPVGTATIDGGVATFPITGGNVTVYKPGAVEPYVQGKINHDGSGLSLTGGGKKVELTDFVVDPGTSMLTGKVTVDGKVFAESAPLFFLDGSTLKPLQVNKGEGTAVLEGTTVSLTKTAADALNMVFGSDALKEFFKVGIAKITVALPKS